MNLCIFSGRLTRDSENRFTQNGKAVSNFCIAVDSGYGDYKRTDFINCVLWNREALGNHLLKGKAVTITGEYQETKYTDKDGNERRKVEIKVDQLEFQQGSPREGNNEGGQRTQQQPRQQGDQQQRGGNNGGRGQQDEGTAFPDNGSNFDSVPF